MYRGSNRCTPAKCHEVVAKSLDYRLKADRASRYLKWGAVNIAILAVLSIDLRCKCRFSDSFWFWLEYVVAVVCVLSAVACFGYYLLFLLRNRKVEGSEAQKMLLTDRNDNSFKVEKEAVSPAAKEYSEPKNESSPIIYWHSSFEDSMWNMNRTSPFKRYSISPTRTTQQQQQQQQQQQHQQHAQQKMHNASLNNSSFMNNSSFNASGISNANASFVSPYTQNTRDDFIQSERSLNAYLSEVSRRERSITEVRDLNQTNMVGSVNSFWNYCNSAAHMLKTSIYQLAPQQTSSTQHKQSGNEDGGVVHFLDTNSEVIKRISTERLSQYVANLRMWLSTTILQRLVTEIEHVNGIFRQRGLVDMKVGGVGLERLRKMAENQQFVNQCAPMLPVLVPFLDLCINQEYLVRRIKDLAEGSCLADYRWNSGGSYNGQKWGDHLPNDTAILFHLFCVYLDSQLMPLPQGGGRPFHSRYVITRKDKRSAKDTIAAVHNKAKCAILCTDPLRPKLNFISDNEIHNCAYEPNNLFYVIIHFLIYMRTHHESSLEGINLAKSGINIMCVIED